MSASEPLLAALRVFRDLGWDGAPIADAPHLPLGTPEQRAVAARGLASGDWSTMGQTGPDSWGETWSVGVDRAMLGLFAVRVGVDARRAAAVMPGARAVDDALATEVLAQRGPAFAAQFIARACVPARRLWTHDTTALAGAAVRLVIRHDLPVPENLDYLKDWATYAAGALTDGAAGELTPRDRGWIAADDLAPRYAEHARAAVIAGVPATGPLAATFGPAVERGWIDRAEALELAFTGLDTAQRPGDRKAWALVVTGPLAATAPEIAARATALLPILAHGDAPVIEALAPALIDRAPQDQVLELLGSTLFVSSAKARRLLLTTAARRPDVTVHPDDPVVELLAGLAEDASPAVAKAAAALISAWSVQVTASAPEPAVARGLWRPTPPLWTVPRFTPGTSTPERVTDALSRVAVSDGVVDPLDQELLLTLTVGLAARGPEAARQALAGIGHRVELALAGLSSWVTGRPSPDLEHAGRRLVAGPLAARNTGVPDRLGAIPVLLSTPSWVDLRIDPADLVERLGAYQRLRRVPVVEADLLLAMLRTDAELLTPALRAELTELTVPVSRQDGSAMPITAGPAVLAYLDDPLPEPALVASPDRPWWEVERERVPESLAAFPARFGTRLDSLAVPVRPDPDRGHGGLDVPAVQRIRRRTPFSPASAIQVIGAARDPASDGLDAAQEAWRRGLLLPGVADIRYLDWWTGAPSNLAALAAACRDLAETGLLAVVWPVLDDLVADGLTRTRMPAGTAEVVAVIQELLPEVTDPDALHLPGVRGLAAKGGSSRAVTLARAVVARLPEPTAPAPEPTPGAAPTVSADEQARWPDTAGTAPLVEDGTTFTAAWDDPAGPGKMVALDVRVPDGGRHRVVKGWFYDLTVEGQCAAVRWTGDTPPSRSGGRDSWLRWADGRLVVGEHRNWVRGSDGPLAGDGDRGPLTTSMTAVVLASLCHDSADALSSVVTILREGLIGAQGVRAVLPSLLAQPVISPARMVRPLTDDATFLPILWPVLTESVRHAAAVDDGLPRWLNTVLDVALSHAALLRWAGAEGRIPTEDAAWPGLAMIAERGGSSAAVRKARELRTAVGV